MGLGDVKTKSYPKMCLVAPPRDGGSIATRCFIPHVCHEAIGVLAAVTVATACVLEGGHPGHRPGARGLQKDGLGRTPDRRIQRRAGTRREYPQKVVRAALLRTARPIMRGEVLISEEIWRGE
jgi:4-oxalomesaconate tautomerase